MPKGTDMSDAVIVVGAGPVGLMLACELGLAGIQVIVVEQRSEPRADSPGAAINSTVVELLEQRGLMDSLRENGFEFPQAHFAHIWLDPTGLRERHEYTFIVPHSELIQRLAEHAGKLSVDIRRGWRIAGISQDDSGVVAEIQSADDSESIRGRYLVGCDGVDSTVRELAGIDFPGTESPFYGVVGDFAVELPGELLDWLGAHQVPLGFCTIGPVGEGVLRIGTGEFGAESPEPDTPVTVDEVKGHMRRLTGVEADLGTPIWLSRWHHITRQADRYRAGRIFLAGDSAHVHFPLGGQALSTGIEDAVNLGWKIAADIAGWAPADLLDTYHEERHPVGARSCLTTQAQVALMRPMSEVGAIREIFTELVQLPEVNEYLVGMAGGFDVRYPLAGYHPLVGRRLPVATIRTATGPRAVTQSLTTGRGTLLDFTGAPADLSGWVDRVDIVQAEPTPDIDVRALLLRPDGRVAWVDDGHAGEPLNTAMHKWFGAPATRQG
jgi:2-polyprenyl-6-methoxyphenol hydroxylase-like FAD-dependent oxidoreductase